jgi:hypothetical protein
LPVPSDFTGRGVVRGSTFVDEAIGVSTALSNLRVKPSKLVELEAVGEFVTASLMFEWAPPSEALLDAAIDAFATGARRVAPQRVPHEGRRGTVSLSGSTGLFRTLHFDERLEARVTLLPACGGKMTILLATTWQPGTFGSSTADAWEKSVVIGSSSPACDALEGLLGRAGGVRTRSVN